MAKFQGNPQGTRTLINELIYNQLAQRLGINTPDLDLLELPNYLARVPRNFGFRGLTRQSSITPGIHLGSRYPANPEAVCIFDFLPSKLLKNLANSDDFWRALVLDVFSGQNDRRQVVFTRDKAFRVATFRAYFVDHGQAFGGSDWDVLKWPCRPTYYEKTVYIEASRETVTESAIGILEQLSLEDFKDTIRPAPREWLSLSDVQALPDLWRQLQKQQDVLRDRLDQVCKAETIARHSQCESQAD